MRAPETPSGAASLGWAKHIPLVAYGLSAEPRITFREIHTLNLDEGRVLMFEVPPAPRGMPIAWKGHCYARAGESLISLGLDKLDEIRQQTFSQDWTAHLVPGATLADLDVSAVSKARELLARKYANRFRADDVAGWPLPASLDRARLTWNGQITRTTLLLLGTAEAAWHLSPHPAQLTWKLEDRNVRMSILASRS